MPPFHDEFVRHHKRPELQGMMHCVCVINLRPGAPSVQCVSPRGGGLQARFRCRLDSVLVDRRHNIDVANLRGVPLKHTSASIVNADPLPVAFAPAGAKNVPKHECRVMGANGHLDRPLVSTEFRVWDLPAGQIQRDGSRD